MRKNIIFGGKMHSQFSKIRFHGNIKFKSIILGIHGQNNHVKVVINRNTYQTLKECKIKTTVLASTKTAYKGCLIHHFPFAVTSLQASR
jgi:hypothetical protein